MRCQTCYRPADLCNCPGSAWMRGEAITPAPKAEEPPTADKPLCGNCGYDIFHPQHMAQCVPTFKAAAKSLDITVPRMGSLKTRQAIETLPPCNAHVFDKLGQWLQCLSPATDRHHLFCHAHSPCLKSLPTSSSMASAPSS